MARPIGENSTTEVTRHLVLGDVALQYTVEPTPGTPLVVAALSPEPAGTTRAMEFLRPADTATRTISVVGDGTRSDRLAAPAAPVPVWDAVGVSRELADHLQAAHLGRPELSSIAPLMLLRTHAAARPFTEVLMCARVRSIGVLFARVGRFDHPADADPATLAEEAFGFSSALQDHVRIEGNAYTTHERGVEIEQKINLDAGVAIWPLAKELWAAIEDRQFPGFITDPGYEFTRWHFVQHNFEVLGPADEVGHIAFQENPGGRYQFKHKKFSADALRRIEMFRKGVEISDEKFDEYLTREFPELEFRRLPGFTRTRFDINVQSVVTGNYFGIEVDETTVLDRSSRKLRQVEIEYLETRWHDGIDARSVDGDLERLTCLVEEQLAKRGTAGRRSFYSKLSFLKECLDEDPGA